MTCKKGPITLKPRALKKFVNKNVVGKKAYNHEVKNHIELELRGHFKLNWILLMPKTKFDLYMPSKSHQNPPIVIYMVGR